jgi:ribosomal protein S18 acetylase RimI-like enzyme
VPSDQNNGGDIASLTESGDVSVRLARVEDTAAIAALHQSGITSGFLSRRASHLLEDIYRAMTRSDNGFAYVAVRRDGRVVGFISGCLNTPKFYKTFLRSQGARMVFKCLPMIFNWETVKRLGETALYPFRRRPFDSTLPQAELLSMAVDGAHQGRGVGAELFQGLVAEFRKRNCRAFRVIVGAQMEQAKRFYQKMGCRLVREVEIHGRDVSHLLVYEDTAGA